MKKILHILCVLFVVFYKAQTSQTENYTYNRVYLEPVTTTSSGAKQVQEVTYFDGLGRPKQNVAIKATPSGKDIVTPVEYDAFGRQVKDMLPLPQQTTNNGGIFTSPDMAGAVSVYGTASNYYGERKLENSPLNRLQEQAAPGDAWKMGSGKTVKYTYESNNDSEVKKFVVNTSWTPISNVATSNPVLSISAENTAYVSGGFYKAGTLYKNILTDEDGNTLVKFTNGKGQVILVRKNDGTQNIDTYYVYNEYGQQAFVIPPLAVKAIALANNTISLATLDNLCYQYHYDNQDRLVEKKFPGKAWEYMVYDKQDRLVLMQDGNLRTTTNNFGSKGWLFTKYDKFGRVVYTGFFSNTATRQVMQNALNSMSANAGNNEKYTTTAITQNGLNVYYTKDAFPTGSMTILSVNYYDEYPSDAPARPSAILGQNTLASIPSAMTVNGATTSRTIKGLPTATYVRNIEDTNWTKDYFWYDTQTREIGTHSVNYLGGYTKTETELDFTGAVKQTKVFHKRLATDVEKVITETFTYDDQYRLLVHKHKVNNKPEETLAVNHYNEIGQVTNKKVGLDDDGEPLQSVDYTFNIRGWLTSINDPVNLGEDLFGMKIKYQNPEDPTYGKAKYNGNISEIDWKTAHTFDGIYRRYAYQYDQLNRLTDGIYLTPYLTANSQNHYYDEKMSYDINGNIKTLNRFSKSPAGVGSAMQIDELVYEYEAGNFSNRLFKVTDNRANPSGYPSGGNAMSYDDNGNMKLHLDKNISSIQYNYLNLPRTMVSSQGNTSYLYRADGVKVKKLFGTKTTDYLNGFQYEDGVLKFFPTSEGFYNAEKNEYVYHYKDHLGNVRFSYSAAEGGGIMLLEESNYYPFGLKHEGYNSGSLLKDFGTNYNYKFLGQEEQESGFYDLNARFYMPELGRFGMHDPLSASTLDAYGYAYNNPIFFSDPMGMEGEPVPTLAPNSLGGDNNPHPIQEVVVNKSGKVNINPAPIMSPSNCLVCNGANGMAMSINLPKPQIQKIQDLPYRGPENGQGGGLMMMSGDMFGISDLLGLLISNVKPENRQAALGVAALAIITTKGKATPAIIKAELAVEKAELTAIAKTEYAAEKSIISSGDFLRIENAASRINKPITVVGSRASGTAKAYSDWDYVIEGLSSKEWSKIKNSIPGARSIIDNTPRNIDIFKTLDLSRPYLTIHPR